MCPVCSSLCDVNLELVSEGTHSTWKLRNFGQLSFVCHSSNLDRFSGRGALDTGTGMNGGSNVAKDSKGPPSTGLSLALS
jgi:hypothetical protein